MKKNNPIKDLIGLILMGMCLVYLIIAILLGKL